MASRGRFCSAHHPVNPAAATSRNTSSRLRAENSMTVLIMIGSRRCGRPQPAFRIDEEVTGRHDAFAWLQPGPDFHLAIGLLADLHVSRLKESVAAIDENHLLLAGIEHGRLRNH